MAFSEHEATKKRAKEAEATNLQDKIGAEKSMNLVPIGFGVQSPGCVDLTSDDYEALSLLSRQTSSNVIGMYALQSFAISLLLTFYYYINNRCK